MRLVAAIGLLVLFFTLPLVETSCTKAAETKIATVSGDLSPLGDCIIKNIEAGVLDPLVLAEKCGQIAEEDILAAIQDILRKDVDAGVNSPEMRFKMHSVLAKRSR